MVSPIAPENVPVGQEDSPVATVNLGTIEPDDENAQFEEDADPESIPTDYEVNNSYTKDRGILTGGVTATGLVVGGPVAFVRLWNATLLWICSWTGCRWKLKPQIPDPYSLSDPNWVLLSESVVAHNLGLNPDAVTPLYRISGTYVYAHRNPTENIFELVNFPRLPWVNDVFGRTITTGDLVINIIDSGDTAGSSKKGTGV